MTCRCSSPRTSNPTCNGLPELHPPRQFSSIQFPTGTHNRMSNYSGRVPTPNRPHAHHHNHWNEPWQTSNNAQTQLQSDWPNFWKELTKKLANHDPQNKFQSKGEFYNRLNTLTAAIVGNCGHNRSSSPKNKPITLHQMLVVKRTRTEMHWSTQIGEKLIC